MSQQTTHIIILAGIYVILFAIEHIAPYFQNRPSHTKHSLNNLAIAAFNSLIGVAFFAFALSHVYTWSLTHEVGLLYQLDLSPAWSLLLAFVLIDLWQYAWHRLNHVVPLLWRFHQVHHADKELDASSGIRFHPIEIILSDSFRLAVIPLIGIQLEQLLIYNIVLIPIVLFHHSNIKLNEVIDRYLRMLIVTPHMHRLHHSDLKKETDSNYASVFSFWDRIFNSYTMRSIENDFRLGLGDKFTTQQWKSIPGMLKIPFN